MKIQLSDHFTYKKLLRFAGPSVAMMLFTSIYGVVDGFFVSNYVGATPFAAVNLIFPFLMILGSVGFMIGTGGTALVSKTLGEGKKEKANETFSLLVYLLAAVGIVLTIVGIVLMKRVAILLGADEAMLPHCVSYGRILQIGLVPFMLQNLFQSFLVTAERPKFGLFITVAAGVGNMLFDYLFMGVFHWGIKGAASATVLSQCIGGVIPLIYFFSPNKSLLRLGKTHFDLKAIVKSATNGASEFVTNISFSVVTMLYNFQLMRFAGEKGVAAFGVLMYTSFIFVAVFIGYSIGTSPLFGFNYGAKNHGELHNLFKKSLVCIVIFSALLFTLSLIGSYPFAALYVGYDKELLSMTHRGYLIYSASFLFCGFNIFASSLFTSLNNGLVSALVSFSRTLLFQVIAIIIVPLIWKLDGVFAANVFAEIMSLSVSIGFIIRGRKKYHY